MTTSTSRFTLSLFPLNVSPQIKLISLEKNMKVLLFYFKALHSFKVIFCTKTNSLVSYTIKCLNLGSKLLFKSHVLLNLPTSSCNTISTNHRAFTKEIMHFARQCCFCLYCSLYLNVLSCSNPSKTLLK